ncbi:MAG: hypothetical protein WC455_17820 [Dehalococcoidia bacterium]
MENSLRRQLVAIIPTILAMICGATVWQGFAIYYLALIALSVNEQKD